MATTLTYSDESRIAQLERWLSAQETLFAKLFNSAFSTVNSNYDKLSEILTNELNYKDFNVFEKVLMPLSQEEEKKCEE